MIIRVTIPAARYHEGKEEFTAIREKPRCQLQCPQHKPAKSRCKRCEYSQRFKYLGRTPVYDFVWENPSHEQFKANYTRDKATDTLINVRIEYESSFAEDEPPPVYMEFKQWFTSLGAVAETASPSNNHFLEIEEKLLAFDAITNNKLQLMRKTSALRPAATEKYIQAFLADRIKKRKELENELRHQYGLD